MKRSYAATVANRTVSQRCPQRVQTHEVFTPGVASAAVGAAVEQRGQLVMRHRDRRRLAKLCC